MNNLSTELKTHRVFIKNEEPVLVSFADFERISLAIEKKADFIRIGDGKFIQRYFIQKIQPISNEERRPKIKYKFKTDEDYNKEFKERFDLKLFHYLEMNEDEKKEFSRANPYQGFQFDFYEKNPNSTLKEQNEALIKFIKESKSRIIPSFLKKNENN